LPQVAKKSASVYPKSNEVDHFRSKVRQVNAEATKFLRTVDCRTLHNRAFVSTDFFDMVFTDFRPSRYWPKLMETFGGSVGQNFLFDRWSFSHVSADVAGTILTLMGKEPKLLFTTFNHLSKRPEVCLPNISPGTASPNGQNADASRCSKRTKLLTEKLQNSNFLNNGRLMASFTSPNKSDSKDPVSSDDRQNVADADASVVARVRLRPKYRHLSTFSNFSKISSTRQGVKSLQSFFFVADVPPK
jgi:hypothetical protein